MKVGDKVKINVGYLVTVEWDGIKQEYVDHIREDVLKIYTIKEIIPKYYYMTSVVLDDDVLQSTTFFTWELIPLKEVD